MARDSPEDMMLSMKSAAFAAAITLGALVLGGCHDAGHHYRHHDGRAYGYDRDWCDDDGWSHRAGGRYDRHRDYARHGDSHDVGYYRRGRHR
jgi:hypothetical protein